MEKNSIRLSATFHTPHYSYDLSDIFLIENNNIKFYKSTRFTVPNEVKIFCNKIVKNKIFI